MFKLWWCKLLMWVIIKPTLFFSPQIPFMILKKGIYFYQSVEQFHWLTGKKNVSVWYKTFESFCFAVWYEKLYHKAGVDSSVIRSVWFDTASNIDLGAVVMGTSLRCALTFSGSHSFYSGTGKLFACEFQTWRNFYLFDLNKIILFEFDNACSWMTNSLPSVCSHAIQKILMVWVCLTFGLPPHAMWYEPIFSCFAWTNRDNL